MPMETSMPVGIRSVQQTKSTDNTQIVRREGGSAPFTPQTNVSLQNAVNDMAGVLEKIAARQEGAVDAMPDQIKKMVENVLRQAFSLETTLGEGLGSTMESQRFSVDQLSTLARLLNQLGNAAEKNGLTELSSGVQTFMKCLREFLSTTDNSFEPVLLHKMSFEMLASSSEEELSPELRTLLLSENEAAVLSENVESGDSLASLKQLLKCFMPAPEKPEIAGNTADNNNNIFNNTAANEEIVSENNGQTPDLTNEILQTTGETPERAEQNPEMQKQNEEFAKQSQELADKAADMPENNSERVMNDTKPLPQKTEADTNTNTNTNTNTMSQEPDKAANQEAKENDTGRENGTSQQNRNRSDQPEANNLSSRFSVKENLQNAKAALEQVQNLRQQIAYNREMSQTIQNAVVKEQTLSKPFENTPQTMETMKDLAGLLLKDAAMTEGEAAMLQKFVNGEQTVLSENDAKQLQLLLRLCESNVPASVRQAAQNNDMPDLPKLWAFMELCDLASLKEQTPRTLRSASRHIADFAASMRGQMEGESTSNIEGERSMNFMTPLYLGENDKSYPAYIHVYDEEKQTEDSDHKTKETWLRICMLTENIGAVELTCRVHDKSKLDVRVVFSQQDAVQGFREYLPEFRASFRNSSLQLSDLKIGMVGAKL